MIFGNSVGTIFFTGAYKTEVSNVSFSIKRITPFNREKNTNSTLKISTLFKSAKTPPSILLINPSATKFAIFVKTFPKDETANTMAIKVTANAVKVM